MNSKGDIGDIPHQYLGHVPSGIYPVEFVEGFEGETLDIFTILHGREIGGINEVVCLGDVFFFMWNHNIFGDSIQ